MKPVLIEFRPSVISNRKYVRVSYHSISGLFNVALFTLDFNPSNNPQFGFYFTQVNENFMEQVLKLIEALSTKEAMLRDVYV